ncbi:MAG: hypothetical protein GYB18_14445 [Oceanospirillales bacterium]|nr:hypothetical protein [Oceanospirillales bacterium]
MNNYFRQYFLVIILIFIETANAEVMEDWNAQNGALTGAWNDPAMIQWLVIQTTVHLDSFGGLGFNFVPKNEFEDCKFHLNERGKEMTLVANKYEILARAGCYNDNIGRTFYYLHPLLGVEQDKLLDIFKRSFTVEIIVEFSEGDTLNFNVSTTGFSEIWSEKSGTAYNEDFYCVAVKFNNRELPKSESIKIAGHITPRLRISADELSTFAPFSYIDQKNGDELWVKKLDSTVDNNEIENMFRDNSIEYKKFSYRYKDRIDLIYFPTRNGLYAPNHDGVMSVFEVREDKDGIYYLTFDCKRDFTPPIEKNTNFEYLEETSKKFVEHDLDNNPASKWFQATIAVLGLKEIENAANQGNLHAMSYLATSYGYGINNINKDFEKSKSWFLKLIGTENSLYGHLGMSILYSSEDHKDLIRAQNHFNSLLALVEADDDSSDSINRLGVLYAIGDIFLGDIDRGRLDYIGKSAYEGDELYQMGLLKGYSNILRNSGVVKSNTVKYFTLALSDYQKQMIGEKIKGLHLLSLKNKNSKGIYSYARSLEKGNFPYDQKIREALALYTQLADSCDLKGNASTSSSAAARIASIFSPDGMIRDYQQSYKWRNISAYMGENELFVKPFIEELEKLMSPDAIARSQVDSRVWINEHCKL